MGISIGRMRHRFSIQESINTPDGAGGSVVVWQDITVNPNIFAEILTVKTIEKRYLQGIANEVTHKIIIRYNENIDLEKRLYDGISQYSIVNIENADRDNKYISCYVKKII